MNILVVGSGARENSLTKLLNNYQGNLLYGYGPNINYGMNIICQRFLKGDLNDFNKISHHIEQYNIEMVIIGPEKPIASWITNFLIEKHPDLYCFAPTLNNSKIEYSKVFTRDLMQKHNLDMYSPRYRILDSTQFFDITPTELKQHLTDICDTFKHKYVIKPDGLTSGKGVKIIGEQLANHEESVKYVEEVLNLDTHKVKGTDYEVYNKKEPDECATLLVEEQLFGEEFTIFTITDGYNFIHSPPFQDFKRLNGKSGPMTGGMGCQSFGNDLPPFLDSNDDLKVAQNINESVITSLFKQNYLEGNIEPYKGVLYGSFIKLKDNNSNNINTSQSKLYKEDNPNNIFVIEFNCRFGDPESINFSHIINKSDSNMNLVFKNASATKNNIMFNVGLPDYSQIMYDTYFSSNIKLYTLNKAHLNFKNVQSLSKYLVAKDYPIQSSENKLETITLDILQESYWILNKQVICGNVSVNLNHNTVECGNSRCFSLILTYSKEEKSLKEMEQQANIFLTQISKNRFYFLENMI